MPLGFLIVTSEQYIDGQGPKILKYQNILSIKREDTEAFRHPGPLQIVPPMYFTQED